MIGTTGTEGRHGNEAIQEMKVPVSLNLHVAMTWGYNARRDSKWDDSLSLNSSDGVLQ